MSPPTLIFIPGAWHRAETWDRVIAEIEPKGYRCIAITLPSTTGDPSAGFGDDVETVQEAIRSETKQGHDVVLVVHSYGGHVGNSAIRGFAKSSHNDSPTLTTGSSGHVIGLAQMATGFTVTGLSFLGGAGGKPPPQWIADTEGGWATIVADPRDMFYHDLPEEEGNFWVGRLTKHSLKSLAEGEEYAYAGWKDVPCRFLVTVDDHVLPGQVQEHFIKTAQDDGADVTMFKIETSHSPMLSQPKKTAEFITEAATEFAKK